MLFSCSSPSASFATVKISANSEDGHNYTFAATTTGTYEIIEWKFGDGENLYHQTTASHYYPNKGEYTVSAELWKDGEMVSDTQIITISQDDPTNDYRLVWSDEFDGSSLSSDWTMEEGYIANNELQDYQKQGNHFVSEGTLKITANKVNDNKEFGSYTSARMKTAGKREFKYGRFEARIKVPTGTGTWPAFWMLGGSIEKGTSWPACGEIDIMEYVGYDPDVIVGSIHCPDHFAVNSNSGRIANPTEEQWHVYGVIWSEEKIEFYLDDPSNIYHTYAPAQKTLTNWPFDQEHFLILNLAIGGDWGGVKGVDNSIFPRTMEVDYVRVYQKK